MTLDINPNVNVPVYYQNYTLNRSLDKGTQPYYILNNDRVAYMNASNNNNNSSTSGGNTNYYA